MVQCRTANRGEDNTFKQGILDVCDQQNDEQAQQVRLRVQGAVSNLHAADAQYHKDCEAIFMSPPRNIQAAKKTVTMSVSKKQIKVGPAEVFDTTLIYSRVLCLQQVHDINIRDV